MNFDKVYTVMGEGTKESFLRALLVKLAQNNDTPVDVVKCKFGEVQEAILEVLHCSAHVEYDVSASIGYNREEQYIEQERYYDDDLKKWRTKNVIKTRTVTDWSPYSAHGCSGDAVATSINKTLEGKYSGFFAHSVDGAIASLKPENIVEEGEAVVCSSALESAKKYCVFIAHDLPGDNQRDVRYNDNVTINDISCYRLPVYFVEFIYNGVKYYAAGYACGRFSIECEYPINEQKVDLKAEGEKVAKPFKIGAIAGWAVYGVFTLLSAILCWFGVSWLWVFSIVGLVATIVLSVKRDKTYNKKVEALGAGIADAKRQETDKALASAGYESLSAEESKGFDDGTNIELAKKASRELTKKAPFIIFSVLLVIIIISSLAIGITMNNDKKSKALHTAEHFSIQVTSKTQEYDPNVSKYINGCYYIYFTYKVESKEIGCEYMEVRTTIYDKNDKEIGTLKTSLENMNLDADSSKSYTTYLQDNQPGKNDNTFFIAVYNAEYSELRFETEIMTIMFSDGKYWRK